LNKKMLGFVLAAALTGGVAMAQTAGAPSAAQADPLPQPNPRFFTAETPTVATVNAFLKAQWGYDVNRIWRVMAIQKTMAPGISRVVVFIAQKGQTNQQPQSLQFLTTPDGKFALAGDQVMPFGEKPFAGLRSTLQQRADGPAKGAAGKDLLLVEFADMQCPHCKESEKIFDQLVTDFPNARVVFQNYPLTEIHPYAYKAASYGVCVAQKSNDAFFTFLHEVFAKQEALTPEAGDQTLAAAATAAGQDPAAIAACASTPATKAKVDAQIKLAEDSGVDQTPMISINGHLVPLGNVPYEVLKQIVAFQAVQDGVPAGTPSK
jgi:protein-disulfide isomerase